MIVKHALSRTVFAALLVALASAIAASMARAQDPLPSWNEGATKAAIIDFVTAVTDEANPDFVAPADRIATFDNDGTLWVEAPHYPQVMFAVDRVKAMAPDHPDWKDRPALKAALDGDMKAFVETGNKGLEEIILVSHSGTTTTEFTKLVSDWIGTAEHPELKRKYTDLTYQPMKELIAYLRDNAFKIYIVTGGAIEFMRPWTETAYGVVPEQVVGSSILTEFEIRDGKPVLFRLPEIFFFNDKEDKPIAIQRFIGRRPIAAFGNSDNDIPMLQWTLAGERRSLGMIVHHTDAEREFAYDRESVVGILSRGIDDAETGGWHLIDMREDWKRVFSFEN